jgi:ACS family hexuronate transporter-like MFS transporter
MPGFSSAASTEPRKIPFLRWWIAAALLAASVLNYVDRQAISLLAPTIQHDLKLSNSDYALVLNLFLAAYTVSYLISGRLVDALGVRVGLALFLGWWSLANLCTGFVRSAAALAGVQTMLGLGEAGNWTAGPKAVAEWFPARERGIALGLCTLGATLGATLAPLLILGLSARLGWQGVFFVTGGAGFLWLIPWLWLYRRPAVHPRLAAAERTEILVDSGVERIVPSFAKASEGRPNGLPSRPGTWRTILARPEVGRLLLARLLTDPVWYFYQFWFAKYLHDERGISQQGLAITWVIFLAADLGTLGGGWLSGRLIRGQVKPSHSRVRVMAVAACLAPLSALVPHVAALNLVLALGMIAVFAHLVWLVNLTALVVDVIPVADVGSTFGVIAAGSTVGGMVMNWMVGRLVTSFSFAPAFTALALLHPIALVLVWRFRRK